MVPLKIVRVGKSKFVCCVSWPRWRNFISKKESGTRRDIEKKNNAIQTGMASRTTPKTFKEGKKLFGFGKVLFFYFHVLPSLFLRVFDAEKNSDIAFTYPSQLFTAYILPIWNFLLFYLNDLAKNKMVWYWAKKFLSFNNKFSKLT